MQDDIVIKYRKKLGAYEYEKKRLLKKNLSADEYEMAIAEIIEKLKL